MTKRASICATLLLIASTLAVSAPLRLEDYFAWEEVSAPQISPDGKTVVYTRARVSARDDRIDQTLWIMDCDGGRNRYLSEGSQVTWSTDSRRIAFVRGTEAGSQIFSRWMDTEDAGTQITHSDLRPSNIAWSPDGKWLAFRATVPSPASWPIRLPARPSGAKWTEDPTVIDSLHYRLDRAGLRTGYKHLFIVPAEGGTPRQLTHGAWHVGANMAGLDAGDPLEWTPDSRSIVFSGDMAADNDLHYRRSALQAVDIDTGEIRRITATPGFWGGLFTGLRLSPDGKTVAYVGHGESTVNFPERQLRIARVDGTQERALIEDLPGYVHSIHWSPDGRGLYYVAELHGSWNLHYVSLKGAQRTVTSDVQVLSVASVSNSGVALAARSRAGEAADIVRFNLRDGSGIRRLTAANEDLLSRVQLGETEEIWYPSSDNSKIQGWIVRPPAFDPSRKYPFILYVHGGPEQMFNIGLSFARQEMAAAGYVLLYVNPRGSTGYGAAFASAIDSAFPGRTDMDDLMKGVDAVIARGYVDTERLYVTGCSAGGATTAWIVGHTDRFAAAAPLCPVINWISFAGTTDVAGWGYDRFRPSFWENPQRWLDHSPLMHVPNVKTPTLIMTGENDLRTPLSQSEELYTALKVHGVPTKLIVMKNESHGTTSRPSNLLRTQLYLRKWFDGWRRIETANGPSWIRTDDSAATQVSGQAASAN